MILKPSNISPNNISVSALNPITVSWKQLGDRQTAFQLKVYKNSDNTLVYDSTKITSYNTFHIIPAETLTNGITYKYQVTNWNSNNESATSTWVIFKCSSYPVVSFMNIIEGGTILNSSYVFQGEYAQDEDVPIRSYQFILYDSSDNIISTSPETFSDTIEYEFAGLLNDRQYKIELQARSQDNLLSATGKITFTVAYDVPKSAISLQAENHREVGGVKLQWNTTQITGHGNNYSFDDGKVDVTDGNVIFDSGFEIKDNFTNEINLESITNYNFNIFPNCKVIMSASPPSDETAIWVENENQLLEKEMGIVMSSVVPIDTENYLWIENANMPVPMILTASQDMKEPQNSSVLWIDTFDADSAKSELMVMKSDTDTLSLQYYNGAFHLFNNNELIESITISADKYYVYIQKIGDNYTLHAEERM